MTAEELQTWLSDHIDLIAAFMDYEPVINTEEELAETLGYWLGTEGETDFEGHRFVHLGTDGTGSEFAVWIRPGAAAPHPVVFFGSEGGRAVLTRSPLEWAQAVAHAPGIDEYPDDGEPVLDPDLNFMLDADEDPEFAAEAKAALDDYRMELREAFGDIPDLAVIIADLEDIDAEFAQWVEDHVA